MRVLPGWYLSPLTQPDLEAVIRLIPLIGLVSLGLGIVAGIRRYRSRLWLFLVSPLLSQAWVGIAGALRGQVQEPEPLSLGFLGFQLLLLGCLIYLSKGARFAASAFTIFSLTYAIFAAFVAFMAFSNVWL